MPHTIWPEASREWIKGRLSGVKDMPPTREKSVMDSFIMAMMVGSFSGLPSIWGLSFSESSSPRAFTAWVK